ncbi:predicted protein [Postia placenta Mad-698-R]|nr:predicted protein [Postia placenta Mad-698-R]
MPLPLLPLLDLPLPLPLPLRALTRLYCKMLVDVLDCRENGAPGLENARIVVRMQRGPGAGQAQGDGPRELMQQWQGHDVVAARCPAGRPPGGCKGHSGFSESNSIWPWFAGNNSARHNLCHVDVAALVLGYLDKSYDPTLAPEDQVVEDSGATRKIAGILERDMWTPSL